MPDLKRMTTALNAHPPRVRPLPAPVARFVVSAGSLRVAEYRYSYHYGIPGEQIHTDVTEREPTPAERAAYEARQTAKAARAAEAHDVAEGWREHVARGGD